MGIDQHVSELLEQTDTIHDIEEQPVETRYRLVSDDDSISAINADRDDRRTWYNRIEDDKASVEDIRISDEGSQYEIDLEYTLAITRLFRPDTEIDMECTIEGTLKDGYAEDLPR